MDLAKELRLLGFRWGDPGLHYVKQYTLSRAPWHRLNLAPAWTLGENTLVSPSILIRWSLCTTGANLSLHCSQFDHWVGKASRELGLTKELAKASLIDLLGAWAEAHAFIESCIFTMEGNWLLKRWNEPLTGQLRFFLFWWAEVRSLDNPITQKIMAWAISQIAPEVSLRPMSPFERTELLARFIQHFYQCRNDSTSFEKAMHVTTDPF